MNVTAQEIDLRVYTRVSEELDNNMEFNYVRVVNDLKDEYPFVKIAVLEGGVREHWVNIIRSRTF